MRIRLANSCPQIASNLLILALAAVSPLSAADLCQGLALDKGARPMTALAKPAVGAALRDPQFGSTLRRITSVAATGANPVVAPLYSTVSAWNADESRLLLYHVGRGHELYDGRTYRFLRLLDINPADSEQVYWHATDPDVLFYVSAKTLVRYHVRAGVKEALRDFSFCTGPASAGADPMFMSFDSNVIGLKCGGEAFFYRLSDGTVTARVATPLPSPQAAASGARGLIGGYVVDLGFNILRRLDLANPYDHASLGRTGSGADAYHTVAFDPGPLGSGVGSLVTFDLVSGASKVVVGPATGFPYPPTGTHVSALAYRQPGWVFLSIVGDPAGRGVLDNEIVVADTASGRVCRAAHHRSFGRENTRLADPYWAEPHVVASPSGTRAVFASDWGNGSTVDTYVLELPSHKPFSSTLTADQTQYSTGQTLRLSLVLQNPGVPAHADLYLLGLRPDGSHLVAFTPTGGASPGLASAPAAWPALSPNMDLTAPFSITRSPFLTMTWNGSEPQGTYKFVVLVAERGSLVDGVLDASDVWTTSSVSVTFKR